ncbi:MAG: hypothetical protein ACE5GI_00190 [Candidatus Aminicenantales bacterium]
MRINPDRNKKNFLTPLQKGSRGYSKQMDQLDYLAHSFISIFEKSEPEEVEDPPAKLQKVKNTE